MKRITLWLFLGCMSCSAQAENWVEISSNHDGGVKQFLDIDSIERSIGLVELWRVFDYKAPYLRVVNGKPYTSQLVRTRFDCEARAMQQAFYAWHSEAKGKGETLAENKDLQSWEIDSFDEFTLPLWKIACGERER